MYRAMLGRSFTYGSSFLSLHLFNKGNLPYVSYYGLKM